MFFFSWSLDLSFFLCRGTTELENLGKKIPPGNNPIVKLDHHKLRTTGFLLFSFRRERGVFFFLGMFTPFSLSGLIFFPLIF